MMTFIAEDSRVLFRNLDPSEKMDIFFFLDDYVKDKQRRKKMAALLRKAGLWNDPCRLFKEGDRARVVERYGRTPTCFPVGSIKVGDIVTVAENEGGDLFIKVRTEAGREMVAPWFMLELVSPVEEREPYYIEEETFDYEIRNANDDPDIGTSLAFHIKFQDPDEGQILSVKSYYESYVYSREHAEADAEAERDRLNEEWRKKVGTEVPCSEEGKE